ncbi:MAG: S9 family peptidase [Ginsengibacter sp.]
MLAQTPITPEMLWKLGRVHGKGVTTDGRSVIYTVGTPSVSDNRIVTKTFIVPVNGGEAREIPNGDSLLINKNVSPDGKYILLDKDVKLKNVKGSDFYPELSKSNAYIYTDMDIRHWDHWNEGKYNHVFYAALSYGKPTGEKDIMEGEQYYSPQQPFGGDEDYVWAPDSRHILYVAKKKSGKAYTLSTNTDIYEYDINSGTTKNLTTGMMGYDINPSYNKDGVLAWLSMRREGYEADKQDIIIRKGSMQKNLTGMRDDLQVSGYVWSKDGKSIYFWAPIRATEQVFSVGVSAPYTIKQITKGEHEVTDVVGETDNSLIVSRQDINLANELFSVDKTSGDMIQLTHVNDLTYSGIAKCKSELKNIRSVDGKQMPTWIVYPPDFDPKKKYPAILFCLGGPQSTTPLYSMRWNLSLIASGGYIVVAPDRRGVLGDGTKWTEQVSKDWSGLVIQDYFSAIDHVSKEKYVDKSRIGCVGASFGGLSVYLLESMHNGRFKTFIAHDGIFDYRSMFGTTDELWFEMWEKGGTYWDKKNIVAQKSFNMSPSNFVSKWNRPIMIVQGGIDYRVPVEQGLQAFQAAQLLGLKSKLLYLPEENHWVLHPQNALVWQREFFKWLKETL